MKNCKFLKKETLTQGNFAKFPSTLFLTEHLRWLLLFDFSTFIDQGDINKVDEIIATDFKSIV